MERIPSQNIVSEDIVITKVVELNDYRFLIHIDLHVYLFGNRFKTNLILEYDAKTDKMYLAQDNKVDIENLIYYGKKLLKYKDRIVKLIS